jgi:hypothetical protein
VEEQGAAGGAKRQVAEFVENDEIDVAKPSGSLPGFALKLFMFEVL